jgi:uncharacterized coiled-coil protein SlyX
MHHYQSMESHDDLVTIDMAGRTLGIAPSAIGYWIVTGQLQATTTESGRRVSLSTVSEVARSSNVQVVSPRMLERHAEPRPVAPPAPTPTAINPQPAESLRSSIRLARLEHRLAAIETTLAELRELVVEQLESLKLVRQSLEENQSRDAAIEEDTPSDTFVEHVPDQPLLTLRLKPVGESAAPHASPLSESARAPVPRWDTLRLVRKSEAQASEPETKSQQESALAPKTVE